MTNLAELVKMSNFYGSQPRFVLAGGGNTSLKEGNTLYVKGSGTSLAAITADGFVGMDVGKLNAMWAKGYGRDSARAEKAVLRDMMDARLLGEEEKRPSVETLLHALIPFKLVLHLHPALVNGLTCGKKGEEFSEKLFPDALFMRACKPGYTLAVNAKGAAAAYAARKGKFPAVIFMQNHGVFFGAASVAEMDALVDGVMQTLAAHVASAPAPAAPDFSAAAEANAARVTLAAATLRALYKKRAGSASLAYVNNRETERLNQSRDALFSAAGVSFTPDHTVYCRHKPLYIPEGDLTRDGIAGAIDGYADENGFLPKIVFVQSAGMFALGASKKEADIAAEVFLDEIAVSVYAGAFGGPQFMTDEDVAFILNWEVENYRQKVALSGAAKRLYQKIAVVTGGAQGYGRGIAEELIKEGALVVVADLNGEGARAAAAELCALYGRNRAAGFAVDVSAEAGVKALCDFTAATYGGIDLFVNNAGIVRAGSLDEMTAASFDLVTKINYNAYFLCAKYASAVMKLAHAADPGAYFDIVQINSKSGLSGSNKNFAYAGSKFGGIGLTQSFALELTPYNIKVNAVCPGNFFDGPLWSDPEKGLFVQYLDAGKIEGAKTVADVKRAYESKIPMGRGCEIADVARAIFYVVEQLYETGQAVPVTGGQNMLR
ncbi:MAG: SDR family NAD(P)-dependent oxidoreductase [Clostridiales bacterium]|jgi:NAD(P)-dependent dehydrogenase (short-subunit alcohol dehydrogenase family)/rhamnose utilization protein RhaD (predicted bifunctional aldolase and dehydrogenase)|nr:SDR family NAD(P)-dependent oxidoreductase [Clostridiales bacterium]